MITQVNTVTFGNYRASALMPRSVCEEEVFTGLFTSHAKSLINFIYYKSGNYSSAEDIMQDAYIKLWKDCAKVELEKAKSFLYTVANNTFLNEVKHKKVVLKFKKRGHSQITNESPQYLLEEAEFKAKLEGAIAALPEDQRVVFLMNRIDKMKYREIAEHLNLSIKAIEKRMHKALLQLRKVSKQL